MIYEFIDGTLTIWGPDAEFPAVSISYNPATGAPWESVAAASAWAEQWIYDIENNVEPTE